MKATEIKLEQPISRKDRQIDQLHENEHRQLKEIIKELTARVDDLENSLRESK